MTATDAPMTLEAVMAAAMQLHRSGQTEQARRLYQDLLEAVPTFADAWHFMGLLEFQDGRGAEGMEAVRRSLELNPDYADAHANLANMLVMTEHYDEAEQHLDRALLLAPDAVPPRIALAMIYRRRERAVDAEALLRPALERDPDHAPLRLAMANALLEQGLYEKALDQYMRAIALNVGIPQARRLIGYALCKLGRFDEAAVHYRHQLEQDPDNEEARHLLAACGGANAPARASDDYIRRHFDGFAASFDVQLARLGYRAPELIADACGQCLPPPARSMSVLDAGCGTGLLGALLAPWSARMTGVDLSAGMLSIASRRGDYDELEEAELVSYLERHPLGFDLIASADTLCYFGALEDVAQEAYAALRPGGWLVFTVEDGASQPGDYRLQFHGRYAHRRDYVTRVLELVGFPEIRIAAQALRMEAGEPVAGLIIAAQKGEVSC